MLTYDVDLIGGITGAMWWPQSQGCILTAVSLNREEGRFTEAPTLRDLIGHILMEKGGDFQNSQFTADTELVITSRSPGRKRVRSWPITAFPSVADYVNQDVFTYDCMSDDEA